MVNEIDKYNDMLKKEYGESITVEIKSAIDDDDSQYYYYTSAHKGDSDDFETVEEAYVDACIYLKYGI